MCGRSLKVAGRACAMWRSESLNQTLLCARYSLSLTLCPARLLSSQRSDAAPHDGLDGQVGRRRKSSGCQPVRFSPGRPLPAHTPKHLRLNISALPSSGRDDRNAALRDKLLAAMGGPPMGPGGTPSQAQQMAIQVCPLPSSLFSPHFALSHTISSPFPSSLPSIL